jgi:ribosomal protein S18 acetylase RimI-like enzyme
LKVYSHKDPEAKPFIEKISRFTREAEAMKLPYWIFVQNLNPIGITAIGKEPIYLLAPPGTPFAFVTLTDFKQSAENVTAFISEAVRLTAQNNVGYMIASFPSDQNEAIAQFENLGFKEFDDCYQMTCQLNRPFAPSAELQFVQVKKEEMRQFISTAAKFFQGSPDVTLTEALRYIPMLPDDFLGFYYTLEKFYFASKNQTTVGILNIDTNQGRISNIGVDAQQRCKGYGKQIMLFGLNQLKSSGCEKAHLRVHVDNSSAIHLYESLGFIKATRYKRLIFRNQQTGR